jgi:hypothetical protein
MSRVVIGITLVLLMLCGLSVPVATAVPIEPTPALTLPPELDDFYKPAAGIVAATPPGGIIRARTITPAIFSVDPMNVDAWQLLYRTNDSHGDAIATVTTVLKPRGAAPEGARKLLSYHVAEDSTAQYCAMSYVVRHGSIPADYVNSGETSLGVLLGLSQGWAVAIPDYEGPNSAYGASKLAGQAALDGIRAAENFEPLQLNGAATPVAMMGYSGGTIPTSWATEIQPEYAPELNIVGASIGGVAPADYPAVLRHNSGGLYAGLIGITLAGFATEYPEVRDVLNRQYDWFGQFMLGVKSWVCHPQGTALFPGWNYMGSFMGQGDPLQIPEVKAAIDANQIGKRRPEVPMYVYHAQNDEIIPIAGVDRVIDWYCEDPSVSITYTREFLAEHISGFLTALAQEYGFIQDRMNGIPAQRGCQISSPTSTLNDGQLLATLGELAPSVAGLLTGFPVGQGR